ncbi:Radical SAM core domain-containing protein [Entamoeba marina]
MDNRKLWFLTLTQRCNLRCTYCGSDEVYETDMEDLSPWPMEIDYQPEILEKIGKDTNPIICFYGGEPLLRLELIYKVMDLIPHATFVLQTNATFLHKVEVKYLHRFTTILVSIDGDRERTDSKRGKGTYDSMIENVKQIKMNGYTNDIVARMTVSNGSDIYKDVTHLLSLGLFKHIHWQMDVCWDSPAYVSWDFKFLEWRDQNYLPGLQSLINNWVKEMYNGKVQGIAPFTGIMYSLLTGEQVQRVRCGSGFTSFNVATNGDITACPIAPDMDIYGNIKTEDFKQCEMVNKASLVSPCTKEDCDVFGLCGGRCLYANGTKWWGEEGFKEVCVTVKEYIKMLKDKLPEINKIIADGILTVEDFHYPSFNNSIEVIP